MDPAKMISWFHGSLLNPMASVKTTKARLPPRIHQLGAGGSSGRASISCASVRVHSLRHQPAHVPAPHVSSQRDPGDRDERNHEGHQVDLPVDRGLLRHRQLFHVREEIEVDARDEHEPADQGDAPQRLHRGVHELALVLGHGRAVGRHARHGLHGHRIGDHVLDDVADRGEQHRQHVPRLGRHHRRHRRAIGQEPHHDQHARGDQPCAEEHEPALPAPDEVHEMAERHLERPGDAGPESQRREEGGGEAEVVLDEEGADDAGQARDAVGHVDHQRREIGEAQLAAESEDVDVQPAECARENHARDSNRKSRDGSRDVCGRRQRVQKNPA